MRRFRAVAAMTVALVLGLTLSSCVNANKGGGINGDTITIGIKFDQPNIGQRDGDTYSGFDVDVATYIAGKLGFTPDKIVWKESPSPQRETLIQGGQVAMIVASYSITDARKEKVSFAGPYFIAGQDLLVRADDTSITGPESLNGKNLCSVAGSTSAKNVKDKFASEVTLVENDKYSTCVDALVAGKVDAVTTDNVILAGYAAQPEYAGKLKVVGKPFSTERYGVGIKKGDTDLCNKINTAIADMISDGSWQKALDKNVGPSGFKYDTSQNPPKQDACS